MSAPQDQLSRAVQLRAAFDQSFAQGQPPEPPAHTDLLAIQVAGHGYALRLSDVLAVHAERKLVPVPSPAPALLGLVGLRGQVVPVYDLRLLLGYVAAKAPRWLALVRAPEPFGIAFDAFEAHWRVPLSDVIVGAPEVAAAHPFASGSVSTTAGPRPLLDLPALVAEMTGSPRRESAPEREERR